MRSLGLALLVLGTLPLAYSQDQHVATTPPRTPEEERTLFRVPPGFKVQLVAAEPDIHKPMNLAFDERGRLWVTDTVDYPFPSKDKPGRDSIKILEDFDEHGRARKVTTFADGLSIPIGIMPIRNGAIVFSIPNVYRLLDLDGDGRADKREVLYGPFGQADTHGMVNALTWGFDGWLYACHGFANNSTIKGADGSEVAMHSGNVFRMRPDGSRVEQYTWGQVNPFGLAFDPRGDLFSADCHSRPLMMLLRGGYYQSFGKPHDGLGFAPEICGHSHNSTAIAGIVYYAADQFPPRYRDTLFVGNVVTNRINHDGLERHGSTCRAVEQPDFLVSDDPWFRPVDLKLGPDGALYVADFYNRIIGHYEVPLTHPGRDRERGRIWRIVYKGKGATPPGPERPDPATATIAELIQDLAHPNLLVRTQATNHLVGRGRRVADTLHAAAADPHAPPVQRAHALRALERLGALDEPALLARADDRDPLVRVHALRVLSERRTLTPALRKRLWAALKDSDALVQRAAADALGRHPEVENVRPLLDLRRAVPAEDTQLLHSVRMTLREQLRPAANWEHVATLAESAADQSALADVAVGVPSAESAHFLVEHLERRGDKPEAVRRYVQHVSRRGDPRMVLRAVAFAQKDRPDDLGHQAALLRAVHQGLQEGGATLPAVALCWADCLVDRLLVAGDAKVVQTGVELVASLRLADKLSALVSLAEDRQRPEALRVAAVGALAAVAPKEQVGLLGRMLADATEAVVFRERVVQALGGINLPEARAELAKHLPTVPARLQNATAVSLAGDRAGAELLLQAVGGGKASARLLQERAVVARLKGAKLPDLAERLAKLTTGLPAADQRFQELARERQKGFAGARADAATGAGVFEKHCAACHQLNGKGMKVGPQLDGIGTRGLERLLEDILDPNRNVDEAFRTTTLALNNGQVVSGLFLRKEGAALVLADAQGKEVRIDKAMVEERNLSPLSPMPANLVDAIPEPEFYHLLAYLLQQRVEKPR